MRAKLPWLLLLLLTAGAVKAQSVSISGVVVAKEDNLPMPGVTIRVAGTSSGTQTDADGKFKVDVPPASKIVASFIGYTTQEIPVTSQSNYKIVLVAEAKALQELVVVGYGEQNRRTVTGAISTVSAEQIKNIPSPSPDQLLQGRSPGVQVSAGSGEPGSSIMVRVRGATSINASSEPLYVIDGVPIVSQNLARTTFGQPSNPLADLNPSDIESMEILKDASATAIYGARAANGVILITTKRGKSGKPTVSISSYVGTSKAWKDPNDLRVDGPTFERLQNEASANNWIDTYGSITAVNPSGAAYKPAYANPDAAINTNWIDPIMQRGALYNIDASVSGGTEKIKYLVSGNTFKQEGIMKPTLFDRKTFRTNLDFSASDAIKLGTSIFYSTSKRNRIQNGNNINSALANAYFYPSNIPVYNADGTYNRPVWESPVAIVNETEYLMNTDRIIGNVYGDWKLANGLVFRTNWSIDNNYITENQYSNTNLTAGAGVGGTATNSVVRDFNWINENVLTYQTRLAGKHNFNILVGNTLQKNTSNSTSATGSGFPSNSFKTIAAAAVKNSTADETAWGIASFFGRVNYDFSKKYLFTGNIRYDGSSRFGANHRWGMFPSASVGWAVSEENFMKDVKVISELKLRASYGVTGNQGGIGNFASLGLWGGQRGGLRGGGGITPGAGGAAAYADYPGFNPIQLANPDLKWETTAQLDLGIDIGLFQDKLNVTFDYYNKQTKDMLLEVPTPRSTGYSTLLQNYGEMENKGFELGINASPVRTESFTWDIAFNISRNKNLVKKLAAPITMFSREYVRIEEGYPLFSFYVHEQLGVNEQTGDIIWNTGSDEVFNVNTDRFMIGKSAWPDFQGGLTNTFNYKGFDLMAFLQYSYGNHVFNYNRYFFEHGGERTTGYSAQQLDRWQQPGDKTDIPRLARRNYDTNFRPSRHIEDASYLRLKNISLGYAIPKSLTSKIGIGSARLYVSGQNVLTFTKYTGLDPEVSVSPSETIQGIDQGVMPQPRIWMGGINLTF
ncbi:TonB-dependent receptor [Dyadobacter sp. CY312]|uniref:SusC/RagA family TonB-linked outer membrane protein n=1 Tax=Dyadobacter sp. CY312 TaxID=2907303 RepID=UPI001F25D6CE|nr:TonB-dependent receptor [Dyadobacter sp. CY312]MCE7040290.1 TonB-dependent receptor [Dyadobacter sp. CY312]